MKHHWPLLASALLLLPACVSQERFDFLQVLYDEARRENETLRAQHDPSASAAAPAAKEKEDLKRRLMASLRAVTRLQAAEAALRARLETARPTATAPAGQAAAPTADQKAMKQLTEAWEALDKQRRTLERQLSEAHRQIEFLENRIARLGQPATPPATSRPSTTAPTQP